MSWAFSQRAAAGFDGGDAGGPEGMAVDPNLCRVRSWSRRLFDQDYLDRRYILDLEELFFHLRAKGNEIQSN